MRRLILSAFLGLCSTMPALAQTPGPVSGLVGLWGAHPVLGPRLQGEFSVMRLETGWVLRVGGLECAFAPQGAGPFRWVLPDGAGEYRGTLTPSGPQGFWIQPAGLDGRAYATPVRLVPAGKEAWRGGLIPLPSRMSLYLNIEMGPEGTLKGSFHNPEAGWTGGAAWFRIEPSKDALRLVDPGSGKVRFEQSYDPEQRRITFDFGAQFQMVPLKPSEAPGFFPRVPHSAAYGYRRPPTFRDGWPTARASEMGMEEALLRDLVRAIQSANPVDPDAPKVHSILVARKGRLVLEEYFFGYQASDRHDLRSASKTLTSILLGAVLDRFPKVSMDTPVLPLFGRTSETDPRKLQITLAHALTHTTGLASDDNDPASPGQEDRVQSGSKDWIKTTLDLDLAHHPGTRYAYSSCGLNLAMGAVGRITGRWIPEVFDAYLARPLGIDHYHMNLMPDGEAYGGGGMHLRPRDLLKFGQLFLDGGRWKGRRVVSAAWVERSMAHQVDAPDGSEDGLGWHRHTLQVKGRPVLVVEANGNGGQFLFLVPSLGLSVVITAGNYNRYRVWRQFREDWLPQFILAACR